MDVCGSLWMFVDLYGCLWIFMAVYGYLWLFLDIYGCLWITYSYYNPPNPTGSTGKDVTRVLFAEFLSLARAYLRHFACVVGLR